MVKISTHYQQRKRVKSLVQVTFRRHKVPQPLVLTIVERMDVQRLFLPVGPAADIVRNGEGKSSFSPVFSDKDFFTGSL